MVRIGSRVGVGITVVYLLYINPNHFSKQVEVVEEVMAPEAASLPYSQPVEEPSTPPTEPQVEPIDSIAEV